MNRSHATQRRPDWAALCIAAFLAVVGAVMLWDASHISQMGGYSGIGPASTPRVVGVALILLGVWTVFAAWRRDFPPRERQEVVPIVWIIAGLALQLILLKPVGFSIATGVLFAFTARAFGRRNLAFSLPVGIMLSFVVWVIFSRLLMLHLPAGPLERLFFSGA